MAVNDALMWAALAFLWGSSFLAIGIGVDTMSPLSLAFARLALGGVLLLFIHFARGGSLRLGARGWFQAVLLGATGNAVPFVLIGYAETEVSTSLAALIMGTAPLITILLAPLVAREGTLGPQAIIGGLLGFCGVAVLVMPDLVAGRTLRTLPLLALLAAALCYAATALLTRRLAPPEPCQMAVASLLSSAALLAIPAMSTFATEIPSTASVLATLYLAIGPTALAALIFFHLVPRIGARRVQQVNFAVPLIGALLGMTFLHETLGLNFAIALPMVVAGVAFVTCAPTGPHGIAPKRQLPSST